MKFARILSGVSIGLSYLYFSFLNVDPLHDGWFAAPAIRMTEGGIPYRDVITSYGWFTPTLESFIFRVSGFHLLAIRLSGFLITMFIILRLYNLLRLYLSQGISILLANLWALIGLASSVHARDSTPAWGLWPNTIVIALCLEITYVLLSASLPRRRFTLVWFIMGIMLGILPWIRGQAILLTFSISVLAFLCLSSSSELQGRKSKPIALWFGVALSLTAPIIVIIFSGSWKNFYWQTIDMPRTGEWTGMPNPISWLLTYGSLSIAIALCALIVLFLLSKTYGRYGRKTILFLILVVILIVFFPISKPSLFTLVVFRKPISFGYLLTNTYLFTSISIFALVLTIVVSVYRGYLLVTHSGTFAERLRQSGSVSAATLFVAVSGIPMMYYNFGHVWMTSPLFLVALTANKTTVIDGLQRLSISLRVVTDIAYVTCFASLVLLFIRIDIVSHPYEGGLLAGMRGTNSAQVSELNADLAYISRYAVNQRTFIYCDEALYAIGNSRYLSDSIFYSRSMTNFDLRRDIYKTPTADSRVAIICPSIGGPLQKMDLNHWVLAPKSLAEERFSKIDIYLRGN